MPPESCALQRGAGAPSAHAQSERATPHYARKCSFRETKVRDCHKRGSQVRDPRVHGVWQFLQLHRQWTPDSTRLPGPGARRPLGATRRDHGRRANPAKKKDPSACNTVVAGAYNPLFKVLCIFPSRYLFAIGLEIVLSFRWNVPPN